MKLQRTEIGHGGKPTLGVLTSRDGRFSCVTLERSVDGEHHCIPAGSYWVVLDTHHPNDPKAYPCPELTGVHGRSEIQIHIANFVWQLLGCIAVGESVASTKLAVNSSKSAFDRLMLYLVGAFPFKLEVLDPPVSG